MLKARDILLLRLIQVIIKKNIVSVVSCLFISHFYATTVWLRVHILCKPLMSVFLIAEPKPTLELSDLESHHSGSSFLKVKNIYLPSCHSKPRRLLSVFRTQMNVFKNVSHHFLLVH